MLLEARPALGISGHKPGACEISMACKIADSNDSHQLRGMTSELSALMGDWNPIVIPEGNGKCRWGKGTLRARCGIRHLPACRIPRSKRIARKIKSPFSTVRPFQKRLACNGSPIPPLHKSSPHTLSLIHPHDHHQTYIHSPIHPFQHPSAHRQSPTPPHPRSLTAANHSMLRKAQPSIGRSRANLGLARSRWCAGLRIQKILL